jgi:D-alanine-D-alanine ligase
MITTQSLLSPTIECIEDDDEPPSTKGVESVSTPLDKNQYLKLKTFGHVSKLEPYVNKDWWKFLFNMNYLKTDADVVEDESITKKEVDFIINIMKKYNINEKSNIVDICCGQGRHLIGLNKMGFKNLIGVDYSSDLLRVARIRSKYNEIKYIQSDVRNIRNLSSNISDYIQMLGNSWGYFNTIEDNVKVLKEIYRLLKKDGIFLLDVTNGSYVSKSFSKSSWEWIDKYILVCRERELSIDGKKLISREIIIDLKNKNTTDQLYSEFLFSIDEIISILSANHFKVLDSIIYDIDGEHVDSGMMSSRYVLICQKTLN